MSATVAMLLALTTGGQYPEPMPDPFAAPKGWKALGPGLWFDPEAKELVTRARVVLREGFLEHLLCKEHTKEHESILSTIAQARMIHAGLLLTGAEAGHPVRFQPRFEAPAGDAVEILARWEVDGKPREADARTWVREEKTGKQLDVHWVFAGSMVLESPDGKQKVYAADSGDLITVANFPEAILDVPIASSADDTARGFVANSERIPPIGTWVSLVLRRVPSGEGKSEARPR